MYWSSAVFHTGNPGVVGFYRTFMQTIHSVCGNHHPVWAVSHAGHCVPPDSMDMVECTVYSLVLYTSGFLRRPDDREERALIIMLKLEGSLHLTYLKVVGVATNIRFFDCMKMSCQLFFRFNSSHFIKPKCQTVASSSLLNMRICCFVCHVWWHVNILLVLDCWLTLWALGNCDEHFSKCLDTLLTK